MRRNYGYSNARFIYIMFLNLVMIMVHLM